MSLKQSLIRQSLINLDFRKFFNLLVNGENSPQKNDTGGGENVHNDAENEVEAQTEGMAEDRIESPTESRDNEAADVETFVDDVPDNDSEFVAGDHPDHECHVSVNITSTDRRKPGKLRVCKVLNHGKICDILEPGTELVFYGYLGDQITIEVVK
jgi:hypothetical protein